MENIVEIEITKTNSSKFAKVINIMKSFPHYNFMIHNNQEIHRCYINDVIEYINHFSKIEPLVLLTRNWTSSNIHLKGKKLGKYLIHFRDFQNKMNQEAEEFINYDFKPFVPDNVASDIVSLDEDLTYPIVYYPPIYSPFFTFAKSINDPPVFCNCQKESIYNYLEIEKEMFKSHIPEFKGPFSTKTFPKIIKDYFNRTSSNPFSILKFEKNLCHRCLEKIPKYNHCASMYGGKFKQKHGWWIIEKYFEYGINKNNLNDLQYINNKCPEHIYRLLESSSEHSDLVNRVEIELENIVRIEFGVALIGESWISETLMFKILESMFHNHIIHRHHRPTWLKGLELDAYIPELKVAFEYNGKQHYEPIEFFGGQEKFLIQSENDFKKARLCEENDVHLITIKYDEDLSSNLIQSKINLLN